ncbi:hypothetical protein OEZ86_000688 [Tetradesmus obliquus]|nr:hypothetical protein OEZ86_000688 [Tetradesmus obliquus]
MACRLHFAGRQYVNAWCLQDSGGYDQPVLDDLPPVVVPYAKGKAWMAAYTQAAMRLVRRLEKGVELRPNCTAEELVLHRLIDIAKISWEEEDEVVAEAIKGLLRSTLDEDFDLVSDAAFQDHDVLMLFDMPQLINTSEMLQMMGCANLHPQDCFKPFKQHLTSNHV